MEDHGLVSVIMPVFNVAPYLVEALDSVVNQVYTNLEIILIDDGSTDGSGAICDRYEKTDKRIRVLHQKNKGLSAARNAGLDIMNGIAVAFLDSDDAYEPVFISSMMDMMIQEGADLVVCGFSLHNTTGKMTEPNQSKDSSNTMRYVYDRNDALRAFADGTIHHVAWNKLYKKELWSTIRYPEGHVYEDVNTTYRIINACNAVCVSDKRLYRYRKREGSITAVSSQSNIRDRMEAQSDFMSFMTSNMPEIFSFVHLENVRQRWFVRLVSCYTHLSFSEEKAFRKELRERVMQAGNEVNVKNCALRIKVCYWMICHFPLSVRVFAPFYYTIRRAFLLKRYQKRNCKKRSSE